MPATSLRGSSQVSTKHPQWHAKSYSGARFNRQPSPRVARCRHRARGPDREKDGPSARRPVDYIGCGHVFGTPRPFLPRGQALRRSRKQDEREPIGKRASGRTIRGAAAIRCPATEDDMPPEQTAPRPSAYPRGWRAGAAPFRAPRILLLVMGRRSASASASRSHGSGKRNFAGRDWLPISGAERVRTAGIRFADHAAPH